MVLLLSFLAAFGAAIVTITIWMTASNYGALPDRIPTHFGFSPEPNGYGPRIMAWMMPLVQIAAFAIVGFAYAQAHSPQHEALAPLLIVDAVTTVLLAAQWMIIETAKNGPSWSVYRKFWFVFALSMLVVPASAFLAK
jgi:uncharacterized membrane protein